jgi:Histidine-specific methyltransferase, SAM-dependent/Trypsin-like peptidase domain
MTTWEFVKKNTLAIRNSKDEVVGTGFIVSERGHLLTCAHVIEAAEGYQNVRVNKQIVNQIHLGDPNTDDFAVLQLTNTTTSGRQIPLSLTFKPMDGFQLFGYGRPDFPQGATIDCNVTDLNPHSDFGNLPMIRLRSKADSQIIQGGYSGSPVFDVASQQVIGIIAAQDCEQGALAIPIATVLDRWLTWWQYLTVFPGNRKILISNVDRAQDVQRCEELRNALIRANQSAIVSEDWLQASEEALTGYDCLLLLISSETRAESLFQQIQRVQQLHHATPRIFLIHIDSSISLPLIQDIKYLTWQSTDVLTLVREISTMIDNPSANSLEIPLPIDQSKWLLTYVGENSMTIMNNLIRDLKNKQNRRIQSVCSYWGVAPTRMWTNACNDPAYHMLNNIREFPNYTQELTSLVDNTIYYVFVSLGVGEGSKDSSIIKHFFCQEENHTQPDFMYIPVDMSREMLKVAVDRLRADYPSANRIAIQRNIEAIAGMQEIARIAQTLGKQKSILYGFIGNTIANVEDPENVFRNIIQVMRTDDLLIFEAQIISELELELEANKLQLIQHVRGEYESTPFRQFAFSALLQNSDLSISPDHREHCYEVDVSVQNWMGSQILQIDCFFVNNTQRLVDIRYADDSFETLDIEERIRLYRSRKFTESTLINFVTRNNLVNLGDTIYLDDSQRVGFMLMMLKKSG